MHLVSSGLHGQCASTLRYSHTTPCSHATTCASSHKRSCANSRPREGANPFQQFPGQASFAKPSGVCSSQGGDVEFDEAVALEDQQKFERIAAALVAKLPAVVDEEEEEDPEEEGNYRQPCLLACTRALLKPVCLAPSLCVSSSFLCSALTGGSWCTGCICGMCVCVCVCVCLLCGLGCGEIVCTACFWCCSV